MGDERNLETTDHPGGGGGKRNEAAIDGWGDKNQLVSSGQKQHYISKIILAKIFTLPQEVVVHTPQTPCRHNVMSQSVL